MLEMLSWILEAFMFLAGYVGGSNAFPKQLSAEEEAKYISLLAQGDEDARHTLIEHNLRLVAHIAKKYSDERTNEDLISIGTIGLIKGINTFNCEKSIRLSSYISRCIENSILTQWKHFLMKKYLLRKHGRYLVKLMITYISYIDIKKIV